MSLPDAPLLDKDDGFVRDPWYAPITKAFRVELLDQRVITEPERQNRPRRALTTRIKIYTVITVIASILVTKTAVRISGPGCINYNFIEVLLSDGWIFGHKFDESDYQYAFFRDQLFRMTVFHSVHLLMRKIFLLFNKNRLHFDFSFGLFFLWIAYGSEAFKPVAIWILNYLIPVFIADRQYAIGTTWVFNLFMLYAQRKLVRVDYGIAVLDNAYKGIFDGWDASFNFSILRMISHNIDYINKRDSLASRSRNKDDPREMYDSNADDSWGPQKPEKGKPLQVPRSEYSFVNYFGYLAYFPLFFNGPTITFNDFITQAHHRQSEFVASWRNRIVYAFRWLFCFLVAEVMMHYTYPSAFVSHGAWLHLNAYELSVLVLYTAKYFWLKMLVSWRYLRMWSLIDGIDPPENMFRCIYNSFQFSRFWRQWHRSFNQWILQYVYIPLGGSRKHPLLNSFISFTFVAMWHNINIGYLLWGWAVVAVFLVEAFVVKRFSPYSDRWWYHYAKGMACVLNIWAMVLCNLYGFIFGKEMTGWVLLRLFLSPRGLLNLFWTLINIYIAVMLMFEVRNAEVYRGVRVSL